MNALSSVLYEECKTCVRCVPGGTDSVDLEQLGMGEDDPIFLSPKLQVSIYMIRDKGDRQAARFDTKQVVPLASALLTLLLSTGRLHS